MPDLIQQMHNIAADKNIGVGEIFEEIVKVAYQDIITPGDKVIDVGAHVGFHLFPMAAAVGKKGKVYAFEPLPHLAKHLRDQIKKRRVNNISFYEKALGIQKTTSTFQHFRKFPAFSGLQKRHTLFDDQEGKLEVITVKQNRLDRVLPWFTKVTLIKLDIEGGELHALMGGEKLIARSRPIIIFEGGSKSSAEIYGYQKEEFFSFFEKLGMSIFMISGKPFTRKEFDNPAPCWEFVAVPQEKLSIARALSNYTQQVIRSY